MQLFWLLLLVPGALLLLGGTEQVLHVRRSWAWPKTAARVTSPPTMKHEENLYYDSSDYTYSYDVKFRVAYSVGSRTHRRLARAHFSGDGRDGLRAGNRASSLISRFSEGASFDIYYDPSAPEQITILPLGLGGGIVAIALGLTLIVVGAILGFLVVPWWIAASAGVTGVLGGWIVTEIAPYPLPDRRKDARREITFSD